MKKYRYPQPIAWQVKVQGHTCISYLPNMKPQMLHKSIETIWTEHRNAQDYKLAAVRCRCETTIQIIKVLKIMEDIDGELRTIVFYKRVFIRSRI